MTEAAGTPNGELFDFLCWGSQGIYVSDMIIEWNHSTEAARLSEEREKMVVQ
jgi:hypothetical protein